MIGVESGTGQLQRELCVVSSGDDASMARELAAVHFAKVIGLTVVPAAQRSNMVIVRPWIEGRPGIRGDAITARGVEVALFDFLAFTRDRSPSPYSNTVVDAAGRLWTFDHEHAFRAVGFMSGDIKQQGEELRWGGSALLEDVLADGSAAGLMHELVERVLAVPCDDIRGSLFPWVNDEATSEALFRIALLRQVGLAEAWRLWKRLVGIDSCISSRGAP